MLFPSLASVLAQGDPAALRAWLDNPHVDLCVPGFTQALWTGPVDASVGRDLCTGLARPGVWSAARALSYCLAALSGSTAPQPAFFPFMHAIIAYARSPEGRMDPQDGAGLLREVFAWEDRRDCVVPDPQFAPLYALLAEVLPLDQALACWAREFPQAQSHMAHLAAMLAIYGAPALGPVQAMVREALADHHLDDLTSDEHSLAVFFASAPAHRLLALGSPHLVERWRPYAPHAIQGYMMGVLVGNTIGVSAPPDHHRPAQP